MLETAIKAAKEAGQYLMNQLESIRITGSHENQKLNPKTKEDEDSELIIIKIIKNKFPTHAFLGEELGKQNQESDYKWIIDPIDGTNNYVDGRDSFSVSIGLEYKSEIILGVVFLPKRDELFTAEKSKGATLNGRTIKVSEKNNLLDATVTYSTFPGEEAKTKIIDESVKVHIPKVKFFGFEKKEDIDTTFGRGSMAAEFCYLACGRIDGLIRLKQKPWDVAAGSLIAKEAGAKMHNLEGKECSVYEGDYIAANPNLLKKLTEVIRGKQK